MRFAYADPPYLGCAAKFYGDATYDAIEAHAALLDRLSAEYPDGWAYSLNSTTLRALLPLCPADVRIGAWVKPFHAFKKGVRPAYAWEPVIYRGGRNENHPPPPKGGVATTPKDWLSCNITLRKGLTGAKPPAFVLWILELLNVQPEDELADIFPGTGIVTETWLAWKNEFSPTAAQLSLEQTA